MMSHCNNTGSFMVLSGTEHCKCLGMISYDIKGHGSSKTLKHTSTVICSQTGNIFKQYTHSK